MSGLFDQITNYSPPLLTAGQVNYKGTWSAAANSPTLVSPPASTSKGDYYVVSAAGTQFGISFAVGDWIISNGTAWEKVDLTDAVSSVFGRTGAITAASGDYTASQVTNVPAGTISSTNVQDAINELSSDITTAQNVLDAYVTNDEAVAITKGQVVYAYGSTGNRMSVKLANNSSESTSSKTIGVVLDASIAAGTPGYIRIAGVVDGLNLGSFTAGQTVYLGATAGTITATKPYAPNHLVYVGIVERANNGNGQLYVKVQNGYELDEIHDVQITSAPASGALLVRDATNSLWKAARLTAGTNIAVTNADASVTVGVTGIIGSSNGGTGNGFTKFSGPTTAEKTFTLPDSNATLLYSGGALGTPSSGTVTNLTGTASININGTVGATTAAAGTFTDHTVAGANSLVGGAVTTYSSNASYRNYIGASLSADGVIVGSAVGDGVWRTPSGKKILFSTDGGNTAVGSLSSTGLAVTGTVTTTKDNGGITLNNVSTGNAEIYFQAGGTNKVRIGLYGGSTPTGLRIYSDMGGAEYAFFSSTGLAVTGSLIATASGDRAVEGVQTRTTGVNYAGVFQSTGSGATINTGAYINASGGTTNYGVRIVGPTSGSNNYAIYSDATAQSYFAGNVGVGTSIPAYKLTLQGASTNYTSSPSVAFYDSVVTTNARNWIIGNIATEYGSFNIASSTSQGGVPETSRFTINKDGNVGIGTTSPDSILTFVGNITSKSSDNYGIGTNGGNNHFNVFATGASGAVRFWTGGSSATGTGGGGTERARIDSSGNLLVGTTSALEASKFEVSSSARGAYVVTSSATSWGLCVDASSSSYTDTSYVARAPNRGSTTAYNFAVYQNSTGNVFLVYGNGNVVNTNGSYGAISDVKLKENIVDVSPKLEKLLNVRVRNYNLKNDENKTKLMGVVAQELEEVFPSLIEETNDRDADGNDLGTTTKSVKYSVFVPILIKSMQEMNANLVAELQSLRQRVAALESN